MLDSYLMKLKSHKIGKGLADIGLLYVVAAWGSTFFIVKGALDSIDPIILIGYRCMLAALILGAILLYKREKIFANAKQGLILGLVMWLVFVPQTVGLSYTTASSAGFITGLFIVFVPIFSFIFYRKRPTILAFLAVAVALAGLWVLTGGLKSFNFGDFLILLSAVAAAWQILIIDKYVKSKASSLVLAFQQFFFVGLFSLASGLALNLPFSVNSTGTWWAILFLAIFATLLANVVRMYAQKYSTPLRVSLIFTLEPVFAAVFAWWLGGEMFTISAAIGGALIVLAMVISELPSRAIKSKLPYWGS